MTGDSEVKKKQRSQSSIEAKRERREQELKSRKYVLECLHKPGIRLILHIVVVL